jgi:hypothetical protein
MAGAIFIQLFAEPAVMAKKTPWCGSDSLPSPVNSSGMRFRIVALSWFLMLPLFLLAQDLSLESINRSRLQKQKASMLALGTWAVGNIALGAGLAGQHQGSERYFHIMNAGWNAVNLGIAAFGYWSAAKADPAAFGLAETLAENRKIQNLLLFNAGLDVGYVMGGLYLMERSRRGGDNADRLKGFGKSIVLQGAFLFAFDLTAYFLQAAENKKLEPYLGGLYFDGQSIGLVMSF